MNSGLARSLRALRWLAIEGLGPAWRDALWIAALRTIGVIASSAALGLPLLAVTRMATGSPVTLAGVMLAEGAAGLASVAGLTLLLGAAGVELPVFKINGGVVNISSAEEGGAASQALPAPAATALWERVRDQWKFELQQLDSAQIACVVHGPKTADPADADAPELGVKLESKLVVFDTDLIPPDREAELNALLFGDAGF